MSSTPDSAVLAYYDQEPQREWERLDQDLYHRLEFEVVHRAVTSRLAPRSRVLELGSGPGRRAIRLAAEGHQVALQDLSQRSLDFAAQIFATQGLSDQLLGLHQGDASTLTLAEGSYDACLVFGPLYHLMSDEQAVDCLRAAVRAVRAPGLVFCIFITRVSVLKDLLKGGHLDLLQRVLDEGYLANGYYTRPRDLAQDVYMPGVRTHTLAEAVQLAERAGLRVEAQQSCEGPAAYLRPYLQQLSPTALPALVSVIERTGARRDVIEGGDHFLLVCRPGPNHDGPTEPTPEDRKAHRAS